jgi:hypothetical protein
MHAQIHRLVKKWLKDFIVISLLLQMRLGDGALGFRIIVSQLSCTAAGWL